MIVDVRTGWASEDAPLWQADHEPTWRDATIVLDLPAAVVPRLAVLYSSASNPEDFLGYEVEIELRFSVYPWDMRYKVQSVTVNAMGDTEVSGTDLRGVRVAELARVGAGRGIFLKLDKDDPPASVEDWYGPGERRYDGGEMGKLIRSSGPKDWLLHEVAREYQLAILTSQPPAKTVERAFGFQPRTAANWIAKAKAAGALRPLSLLNASEGQRSPESFSSEDLFRMQRRSSKPSVHEVLNLEDIHGEHR